MVSTEQSSLAAKPGGDGFDRTIVSLLLRAKPGGDGFDRTVVSPNRRLLRRRRQVRVSKRPVVFQTVVSCAGAGR